MVDVGAKAVTARHAHATAVVRLPAAMAEALAGARDVGEVVSAKGPVFATAVVAGIQAAKRTSDLIPLCHPLPLRKVDVRLAWAGADAIKVDCEAWVSGQTGVEMEALTGASVAALTVYDMLKALGHGMVVEEVRLERKSGGKRDFECRGGVVGPRLS